MMTNEETFKMTSKILTEQTPRHFKVQCCHTESGLLAACAVIAPVEATLSVSL